MTDQMGQKGDLKTISHGLIPTGFNAANLPPKGRDEVREAIDAILRIWDYTQAKTTLALEQLDKAAAEIDRLKAEIAELRSAGATRKR